MGVTQKEMGKKLKYTFIFFIIDCFITLFLRGYGIGWRGWRMGRGLFTSQLHWSIATCRRGLEKHRCNFFSSGLVQVYLSVSLSLSLYTSAVI